MAKKLYNLSSSLQTRINTAYSKADGDSGLFQSSFRSEMATFSHTLPSLLTLDSITKHTAIPIHSDCKCKSNGGSLVTISHRVEKGETLWSIMREKIGGNVTVDQIKKWNGLKNDIIKPGQELIVGNIHNPTSFSSNIALHYPQMGEILNPELLNKIICVADKARIEQPHAVPYTNVYAAEKDIPVNYTVQNAEFRPLDRPYQEKFEIENPESKHHGDAMEKIIIFNDGIKTSAEYAEHFSNSSIGNNLTRYKNGWGGNQYVKTVKFAKIGKFAGKACFVVSIVLNTTEMISAYNKGDNQKFGKAALNLTISAIATFGGPVGWAIGAGYLLLDIAGVFDPGEGSTEIDGSTWHYVSPVVPIDHTMYVNPFLTKYKLD